MDAPQEQCSLDSPALVSLCDRMLQTPSNDSLALLPPRENYILKVHARAADFSSPGCDLL